MALLDEEIVEQWLNQQKFFTMRGIKSGNDEIDFLAVNPSENSFVCWHVEVQVSFRPIGYIGGDSNARKRTEEELKEGVEQWVHKKFSSDRKKAKRESVLPGVEWNYVLVCGELKDAKELVHMENSGVRVIRYKEILDGLVTQTEHQTSSVANNIVEILKYSKHNG